MRNLLKNIVSNPVNNRSTPKPKIRMQTSPRTKVRKFSAENLAGKSIMQRGLEFGLRNITGSLQKVLHLLARDEDFAEDFAGAKEAAFYQSSHGFCAGIDCNRCLLYVVKQRFRHRLICCIFIHRFDFVLCGLIAARDAVLSQCRGEICLRSCQMLLGPLQFLADLKKYVRIYVTEKIVFCNFRVTFG